MYFEVLLLVIASLLLYHTFTASWILAYTADTLGTAFLPRLALFIILVASTILLIQKYRTKEREKKIESIHLLGLVIYIASAILYILCVYYIGLFMTTFSFLFIWQLAFGVKRFLAIYKLVLISLVGSVSIYFLMNLAGVYFPRAILF